MIRSWLINRFARESDPDLIAQINDTLLYDTPAVTTECGFVLGCRGATGEVAREAVRLYRQGHFDKIIVSGGVTVEQGWLENIIRANEHLSHHNYEELHYPGLEVDQVFGIFKRYGIPKDDVLFYEGSSTNTGENIQNCLRELEQMESITIVCRADNQKRAHATARHWLGERPVITTVPVFPFGVTRENWHETPLSYLVKGEMKKLDISQPGNYVQKGFCVDLDVSAEMARLESLSTPEPRSARIA